MASGDLTRHFGDELVERLATMLERGATRLRAPDEVATLRRGDRPGVFDRVGFEAVRAELDELSLMQRVRRIGEALVEALPESPEAAWAIMAAALPEPLPPEGQPFNDGYWMLPLAAYWAVRYERVVGGDATPRDDAARRETAPAGDTRTAAAAGEGAEGGGARAAARRDELWPVAIHALSELTQRGTAEFAVRTFAADDPKRMLEAVAAWREHRSFHVRRLATEGTRPYLPWGGKLRVTRAERLALLEAVTPLCRDSSAYVRRSVGNHVRDWRRIEPEVADRWIERVEPPEDVVKLALPKHRTPGR